MASAGFMPASVTKHVQRKPCWQSQDFQFSGYIGIMEKKMETTIMGYIGIIGYILGLQSLHVLKFSKGAPCWGSQVISGYGSP